MKKGVLNRTILLIILFFFISLSFEIRAITFENPFDPFKNVTFETLIENIINFIFWVAMAIVPILIIVAAFYFLTSGGNPEKINTAKRIIFYTIIGLIIIFLAKGIPYIIKWLIEGPPKPVEICDNGIDDDGDGFSDCLDPDCIGTLICPCEPICKDLVLLIIDRYQASCGSPRYDPIADVSKDKRINLSDVVVVAGQCSNAAACQAMWNDTSNPCP